MDDQRLLVVAEDCMRGHPRLDSEEAFLRIVASRCIEAGYLRNTHGFAKADLGRLFSERQRKLVLQFFRNQVGRTAGEGKPVDDGALKEEDAADTGERDSIIPQWRGPMLFGFGSTFVVALLILAIFFPEPSPFQYFVFRLVLALAASGISASIPGFLEVEVSNMVKGSGALAVFVIVFFFSPASLVTH